MDSGHMGSLSYMNCMGVTILQIHDSTFNFNVTIRFDVRFYIYIYCILCTVYIYIYCIIYCIIYIYIEYTVLQLSYL